MGNSLRAKTVVLSGGRIQLDVPELAEGLLVDVIVVPSVRTLATAGSDGIADFLRSLPPVQRDDAEWQRRDHEFEKDREKWDR